MNVTRAAYRVWRVRDRLGLGLLVRSQDGLETDARSGVFTAEEDLGHGGRVCFDCEVWQDEGKRGISEFRDEKSVLLEEIGQPCEMTKVRGRGRHHRKNKLHAATPSFQRGRAPAPLVRQPLLRTRPFPTFGPTDHAGLAVLGHN